MKKSSLLLILIFQSILLFGQYNNAIPPLPDEGYFSINYLKKFKDHNHQDIHSLFKKSYYTHTECNVDGDEYLRPNSMIIHGIPEDLFVRITYRKDSKKVDLIMWNTVSSLFKRLEEELIKLGFYEEGTTGLTICYKNMENMEVCLEVSGDRETLLVAVAMPKNIVTKQKQTNQKKGSHKK